MRKIRARLLSWLLPFSILPAASIASPHPFDDLSADEIKQVVRVVRERGGFPEDLRFPVVRRAEPSKADWLAGRADKQRVAYAAVFDIHRAMMTELLVDLREARILSRRELPGLQPPVLLDEYERARALIRADGRWQAAMRRRGFTNLDDDLFIDPWAPGLLREGERKAGQRLLRGLTYKKAGGRNFYSRPVEGVVATVDLAGKKVLSVWDVETAPVAPRLRELGAGAVARLDPPLTPLEQSLPRGTSYRIDGQEVSWGRWKFRLGMDPMQGLQLFHVRFRDGAEERTLIYKLSLSEMLVPYGNPLKSWSFRNAFDVGEYGLGKTLHPLVAGLDVPSHATLLDTAVSDDLGGEPSVIKGMAVYERDAGVLWKHRNAENGEVDIRRARELVATFMTTVGNYDYGVSYVFGLDGTIKVDAQLTGILLAKGTVEKSNPCDKACRTLVEGNVLAPPHQHFFNFRIDFDIDGAAGNMAAETNVRALPQGKGNPDGNAFEQITTVLSTERAAVRDLNASSARKWKVFSSSSRNAWGHPRGYALFPGESAKAYLQPGNQMRARARFVEHQAWFTSFKDDEMSAAAPYPTTAPAGAGLPRYISDNQKLDGSDVVMWYTFGVTHIPHPEEWPIMSAHHTGFSLVPMNFFSENPSLSLSPEQANGH